MSSEAFHLSHLRADKITVQSGMVARPFAFPLCFTLINNLKVLYPHGFPIQLLLDF